MKHLESSRKGLSICLLHHSWKALGLFLFFLNVFHSTVAKVLLNVHIGAFSLCADTSATIFFVLVLAKIVTGLIDRSLFLGLCGAVLLQQGSWY